MLNKFLPFIFLFSVVSSCSFFKSAKEREIPKTNKSDFITQIKQVDCDNSNRFNSVINLYRKVGIEDSAIKVEEFGDVKNIVLTINGETDEMVVVGGHYDKTTLGCGAIDNWTGIVMVANLYDNFKKKNNKKSYKFVAFGKEELGLIGSKSMVEEIPKNEITKYCAMVNFDSFGFSDVWNLEAISDSDLIDLAEEIAQEKGFVFESKNFKGASSDSESFIQHQIPAITLSGLNENWREYLHREKDQVENIDFNKVFDNFLFAYDFLTAIEAKPCNYYR